MKISLAAVLLIGLLALCIGAGTLGWLVLTHSQDTKQVQSRPLTAAEATTVHAAIGLMQQRKLTDEAALATCLLSGGIWRAALPDDRYLKQAEQAGDTPYAYTLSSGSHPSAIVLAPRFFTETTPTGRAALMLHEMGHYRAYTETGRSDEYDGYKAEYDTHAQLGLTEQDGLVYFSMLDGVAQYVVPRAPAYKSRPDVQSFITQSDSKL